MQLDKIRQLTQMSKSLITIPTIPIGIAMAETIIPILQDTMLAQYLNETVWVIIYLAIAIVPTLYAVWRVPNTKAVSVDEDLEKLNVKE